MNRMILEFHFPPIGEKGSTITDEENTDTS